MRIRYFLNFENCYLLLDSSFLFFNFFLLWKNICKPVYFSQQKQDFQKKYRTNILQIFQLFFNYPIDSVKYARTPEIIERLIAWGIAFWVFWTDVFWEVSSSQTLTDSNLQKIWNVDIFSKNPVKVCLLWIPEFFEIPVAKILTKYPNLVRRLLDVWKPEKGNFDEFYVQDIEKDTGSDLEQRGRNLSLKSWENVLVADIVSSGKTAQEAWLVVYDTLLKVEYVLCTSLTTKERIKGFFSSKETLLWSYAWEEISNFLGIYPYLSFPKRKEYFKTLKEKTFQNVKKYFQTKTQIGRFDEDYNEVAFQNLLERELKFLEKILFTVIWNPEEERKKTFPLLKEYYRDFLESVFLLEYSKEDFNTTAKELLQRSEDKDKKREDMYLSWKLWRFAMHEWDDGYKLTPKIEQEIENIKNILT